MHTQTQEYILLAALSHQVPAKIRNSSWATIAKNRTFLVDTPDLHASGTMFYRTALIPGNFLYRDKYFYSHIMLTHHYPDRVMMAAEPEVAHHSELLRLMWVFPAYQPEEQKIWEPSICRPPKDNDLLYLFSARLGIIPVEVIGGGKEDTGQFKDRLLITNLASGFLASLIYREDGRVAGVAMAMTDEELILAIPGYSLMDFYCEHKGSVDRWIDEHIPSLAEWRGQGRKVKVN